MADVLKGGEVLTALNKVLENAEDFNEHDRKIFLEKILGREVTSEECGTVGSKILGDGLSEAVQGERTPQAPVKRTRQEYFKLIKNLRKFETRGVMPFGVWKESISFLLEDDEIPVDIGRDLVLSLLGDAEYTEAFQAGYAHLPVKELVEHLEADYVEYEDLADTLANFYGMRQRVDETVLSFVRRVRKEAENVRRLKQGKFEIFNEIWNRVNRGCIDKEFRTELKICQPKTGMELIQLAKKHDGRRITDLKEEIQTNKEGPARTTQHANHNQEIPEQSHKNNRDQNMEYKTSTLPWRDRTEKKVSIAHALPYFKPRPAPGRTGSKSGEYRKVNSVQFAGNDRVYIGSGRCYICNSPHHKGHECAFADERRPSRNWKARERPDDESRRMAMVEGAKHWPSPNEGDSQTDLGEFTKRCNDRNIDCRSDKEEPYAGVVKRKPNLGTGLGDMDMDVTAEKAIDCKSDGGDSQADRGSSCSEETVKAVDCKSEEEETYAGIVKRNLGTGLGDINMDVVKEGQDFCGGLEGDGEFQAISRSRM